MDWTCQCAVIIPCFNEAAQIAGVVAGARAYLPSIIVVDDGSTDETAKLAREAGAEVLRYESNRGKGAALQAGWERARELGFKWILTLDGDGQHGANDIPKFFERANETGTRLIVGDRMGRIERMPRIRQHVNRWMTNRLSRLTGAQIADSQCGFRLIHLETLAQLPLNPSNRFEIESELLVAFLAAGCAVDFVPVEVIPRLGRSKINPLLDTWRWFRWWLGRGAFQERGAVVQPPLRAWSTIRVPQ